MRDALALALVLGVGAWSLPAAARGADARHGKVGALAFAEAVVQTYLDGDHMRFRSYLADTLCTLEGEGPFEADSLDLGDPFPFGRDYSTNTMAEVKAAHPFVIYSYDELSEFPGLTKLTVGQWSPDADDYLFVGTGADEEGRPVTREIIWDDLMVFMVTYQNDKWEIICLSG